MSGNPGGWHTNPTAAVVVSVIVAVLGVWMIRTGGSELTTAFGWLMIIIGVVGGAANLYIRHKWKQ